MALPAASANYGTKMDKNQVLKTVYDATKKGVKCVDAGVASGDFGTSIDANQVWKMIFDPDNSAIRVVAV